MRDLQISSKIALDSRASLRQSSQIALDSRASRYFSWRQLVHAGETWHALAERGIAPANVPQEQQSWDDYAALAARVLDPLWEAFGSVQITYGFSSWDLSRQIKGRCCPGLDQHAASEQRLGKRICPRQGAAVDVQVAEVSSESLLTVVRKLAFDRAYYYGPSRPLHVSYSESPTGCVVDMVMGPSGRLLPRVRR